MLSDACSAFICDIADDRDFREAARKFLDEVIYYGDWDWYDVGKIAALRHAAEAAVADPRHRQRNLAHLARRVRARLL